MSIYVLIFGIAAVMFIITTIMAQLGMGESDMGAGVDGDFDGYMTEGDSIARHLSFKNIINFLVGFGFCGMLAEEAGYGTPVVLGAAVVGGAAAAWVLFQVGAFLMKMGSEAPGQKADALGHDAKVTLSLGGGRSRRGKIMVHLRSGLQEHTAVTDYPEDIPAQAQVIVVDLEGNVFVVMPKI